MCCKSNDLVPCEKHGESNWVCVESGDKKGKYCLTCVIDFLNFHFKNFEEDNDEKEKKN